MDQLRSNRRGVLRLALPDLDRAIGAYLRGDTRYFYIPDDAVRSAGRETRSAHPGIVELDNRERESLFVEAIR